MSAEEKTVWIIAGPTASGKSQLALDLARQNNGVVINADSMQIYREIPILTAQPPQANRLHVAHVLYGFHGIAKQYSAAQWAQAARKAIDDVLQRGQQPILTGGSGLYFKALIEGFSQMPDVPQSVRKHVTDLYDMLGPQRFHDALSKIDPLSAEKLNPADRQRCIRAREVYEVSNEAFSAWQKRPKQNVAPDLVYRSIVLLPNRDWLYARINTRFDVMLQDGALQEAQVVQDLQLGEHLTGLRALGLQALGDYLQNRLTLQEAVEQGQNQSRQYAKRQYTWFRNQPLPQSLILNGHPSDWLELAQKHLSNVTHVFAASSGQ